MKSLPYGRHHIDEDDIDSIVQILRNGGDLTQGPLIHQFETEFAKYVGANYALAVSSCTAGLHISCLSLNLGKNDTVATSNISFVSSANCASFTGAKVEFIDIEASTLNLSIDKLEERLKSGMKIKIVIPVHFAGFPINMKRLQSLSYTYKFNIIEDAAHALGSEYFDGNKIGCSNYSDATVFSLHPVKSITAGEGGVVTTNNENTYKKLLRLRSHGINKNDDLLINKEEAFTDNQKNIWYYEMQTLGFHYRITDIQCALALSQLKKLKKFVDKRKLLVEKYRNELKNNNIIKPAQKTSSQENANHIFPVRINFESLSIKRNDLMIYLRTKGIISQVHYIPITIHPYYRKNENSKDVFEESFNYYNQALTLPLFYDMEISDIDFVLKTIEDYLLNDII